MICFSAFFLVQHVRGTGPGLMQMMKSAPSMMSKSTPAVPSANPNAIAPTSTPKTETPTTPSVPAGATVSRKIGFSYRNSRAKKVMIRADFTGWRAEAMEKDPATGAWKYMAVLEPGEYAYCFSVDDKSIKDPANKHTKLVGKTVVSSIIVQPPAAAPAPAH